MTSSIQSFSTSSSPTVCSSSSPPGSPIHTNELFVCGLYTSGQTGLVRTPKVSVHQAQYYPQYYSFAEPCKLPPILVSDPFTTSTTTNSNDIDGTNNTSSLLSDREESSNTLESTEQSNENSLITCRETLSESENNMLFTNDLANDPQAEKLNVSSIVCGWYHTVLLTDRGQVWSCGANYSQQAGHTQNSNVTQFTRVNAIQEPVQSLSCGGHHSIALTTKGNLYVWGECREGQLGIELSHPPISSTLPTLLDPQTFLKNFNIERRELMVEHSKGLLPIDDDSLLEPNIGKLCCGGYHSIFVMSDGSVASCGKNTYGQCGTFARMAPFSSLSPQDHEFKIFQPTLLREFEIPVNTPPRILREFIKYGERPIQVGSKYRIPFTSIEIVDCAAGAWHSILITSEGKTFGMGDTQYGQLSIQEFENDSTVQETDSNNRHLIPHLITSLQDEKICSVACGYFHSVFLTYDGRVYTNGWNAYGQLLNGNTKTQRFVYPLKLLYGIPICKVACGWNHCVLLSRNGECYVGGEGKHGQLGYIQTQKTEEAHERMYHHTREDENQQNCFVCRPVKVEFFRDVPIRDVACGRGHTIFLTGMPHYCHNMMSSLRKKLFTHVTTCNDFSDITIIFN